MARYNQAITKFGVIESDLGIAYRLPNQEFSERQLLEQSIVFDSKLELSVFWDLLKEYSYRQLKVHQPFKLFPGMESVKIAANIDFIVEEEKRFIEAKGIIKPDFIPKLLTLLKHYPDWNYTLIFADKVPKNSHLRQILREQTLQGRLNVKTIKPFQFVFNDSSKVR